VDPGKNTSNATGNWTDPRLIKADMAVGEYCFPEMPEVSGIRLGTANAGIKQTERDDVLVVEMAANSACAAVFTNNAFCAAPVKLARENLKNSPGWLLVNSGNANAGTGQQGVLDTKSTCEMLSSSVAGGDACRVLPFSTGVIGESLPLNKLEKAIPVAVQGLSDGTWENAANAIMTTDTRPKGSTREFEIEGRRVVINGIAKGSGMIHPDMATMLSFIGTNANVEQETLSHCLPSAVEQSFNRISVDGDTSTNDACVLMATGAAGNRPITVNSQGFEFFRKMLQEVCAELAELIIRDGEGATKLLRIVVQQALSEKEALTVAQTIASSPLVKTAVFASDPNWGRILAAIGRSGLKSFDIDRVVLWLGDVLLVCNGGVAPEYCEEKAQRVMDRDDITIRVLLGRGSASQTFLSCDFSYDYVRINADYRT